MNFDLSEEAKSLRSEVQRFLRERSPASAMRAVTAAHLSHDADIWRQVIELGWPGVAVPEKYGGAGMGYESLCVVAEAAGGALLAAPLMSTFAAIEALLMAGSDAQKSRWIPELISGGRVGAVALAESFGNPDPRLIQAQVRDGRLSGSKLPVADGTIADLYIVAARAGVDVRLYVVEADPLTVSRSKLDTLDLGRLHARIHFAGARCDELVGNGDGWSLVERLLDRLAMITAFEQLGGAGACLDMAVAHAKQRIAFSRPIGSFQAVKHKLADIFVALELARSNAYFGAWALDHDCDETLAASSARISAIEAFESAARENIHVHGAQGFTWEQDCHLYFRRSRMLASALGTAGHWKQRLINSIDEPASIAKCNRGL